MATLRVPSISDRIDYFLIPHNTLCLPPPPPPLLPQILHKLLSLNASWENAVLPGAPVYAKFWGAIRVYYGEFENREFSFFIFLKWSQTKWRSVYQALELSLELQNIRGGAGPICPTLFYLKASPQRTSSVITVLIYRDLKHNLQINLFFMIIIY